VEKKQGGGNGRNLVVVQAVLPVKSKTEEGQRDHEGNKCVEGTRANEGNTFRGKRRGKVGVA